MPRLKEIMNLVEEVEKAKQEGKIELNRKESGIIYALIGDGRYVSKENILEMLGESVDKYTIAALTVAINRANTELKKIGLIIANKYGIGYKLTRKKDLINRKKQKITAEQRDRYREKNRLNMAKKREQIRERMANPSKEDIKKMKEMIDRMRKGE